ncbi:hypothetical protein KAU33_12060, partial [Candidatus Dependentiae bacterium]|nr:hypothetical protein [Candidatus Dependentiae bacterium]
SMRLLSRIDQVGQIPALEIMRVTSNIQELIQHTERVEEINDAIKEGSQYGMVSFDQSLLKLLQDKIISYDEALSHSSNPNDFALAVSGFKTSGDLEKNKTADEMMLGKKKSPTGDNQNQEEKDDEQGSDSGISQGFFD